MGKLEQPFYTIILLASSKHKKAHSSPNKIGTNGPRCHPVYHYNSDHSYPLLVFGKGASI
jgi:hypothetical protein